MPKNKLLIVVGAVAVLVIAGFLFLKGGTKSTSRNTSQQASTGKQTSTAGGTEEDLTFTGAVNGRMTQGFRGDTYSCATVATGPIVGKIGGVDYTFEFRSLNATGPGNYKAYVQIGPLANKNLYYGSDNTSLTINSDKRSGSVEGDLSNLSNSAEKVHISGDWTCPPDF